MDQQSPVLAIVAHDSDQEFYNQAAVSLGYSFANVFIGTPYQAAQMLANTGYSPRFIIIDVDDRGHDVLPELDKLAEFCDVDARVVVLGTTNDIGLYRALLDKGVLEYLPKPVEIDAIRRILIKSSVEGGAADTPVISCIGAAAGDGSSTIALNTAYSLAMHQKKPTVLVDLDYQFGMIAKNLDLAGQYGIREILDHPDRGIDSTLLERMVVPYNDLLHVVAAPAALHYMPTVKPETIRDLIQALQSKYYYTVLDLPHVWNHWVTAALTSSHHIILTAQLWLKSVTHCSRLLNECARLDIHSQNISVVINRSGSKFKEAVHARDFERVTAHPINFYISNDIKTVVRAENKASTIIELGRSSLANQIEQLADSVAGKLQSSKSGPAFRSPASVHISQHEVKRLT